MYKNTLLERTYRLLKICGVSLKKRTLLTNLWFIIIEIQQLVGALLIFADGVGSSKKSGVIPVIVQVVLKLTFIKISEEPMARLLKSTEEFWPRDTLKKDIINQVDGIHRRVRWLLMTYVYLNVLCFALFMTIPLLSKSHSLAISWYLLCERENPICYWTNYGQQGIFLIIGGISALSFDVTFMSLLTIAFCELEVIKCNIRQLDDGCITQEGQLKAITTIGFYHQKVLKFVSDINNLFSEQLAIYMLLGTLAILFSSIAALSKLDGLLVYGSLVVSLLFQFALFCFAGQIVYDQSLSICNVLYGTNWWHMSRLRYRNRVWFMLMRSQHPARILIGRTTELISIAFLQMVKASFSYMAVASTLYSNDDIA